MQLKWFSVKTVYRVVAEGEPTRPDAEFDPSLDLLEERVVLVRAGSYDEAIERAEKEAAAYESRHTNPYGQQVLYRYLGAAEAFELFDSELGEGTELYSQTRLVPGVSTDDDLIELAFGLEETARDAATRKKFLNSEFSGRSP